MNKYEQSVNGILYSNTMAYAYILVFCGSLKYMGKHLKTGLRRQRS